MSTNVLIFLQPEGQTLHNLAAMTQQGEISSISGAGGVAIPVRSFPADQTHSPVVQLHGLQSHSGWFAQSGSYLASCGFPVFGFDRRGSGLSKEPRGDCRRYTEMLDDIAAVINHVRQRGAGPRVHLVGHCFGAIPAALYAARHPEQLCSLVLATPAIFTKVGLAPAELLKVAAAVAAKRSARIRLPFTARMLSEVPEFIEFALKDPLALDALTASFYYQIFCARRELSKLIGGLRLPVCMMVAEGDQIADNNRNLELFTKIPAADKCCVSYPGARHILEFSGARQQFLEDLSRWLERHDSFPSKTQ